MPLKINVSVFIEKFPQKIPTRNMCRTITVCIKLFCFCLFMFFIYFFHTFRKHILVFFLFCWKIFLSAIICIRSNMYVKFRKHFCIHCQEIVIYLRLRNGVNAADIHTRFPISFFSTSLFRNFYLYLILFHKYQHMYEYMKS